MDWRGACAGDGQRSEGQFQGDVAPQPHVLGAIDHAARTDRLEDADVRDGAADQAQRIVLEPGGALPHGVCDADVGPRQSLVRATVGGEQCFDRLPELRVRAAHGGKRSTCRGSIFPTSA